MDSQRSGGIRRNVKRMAQDTSGIFRVAGARTGMAFLYHLVRNLPEIFRSRTLSSVDTAMDRYSRTYRPFPHVCVRLPPGTFSGAREMYCRQVYFWLPNFVIKPQDIVVDLGANQGLFSVVAAKAGARVIAVEAQAGFAEAMDRNLRMNNCANNVALRHGIVGANIGVVSQPAWQDTASHWTGETPILEVEEILQGIDRVDLLKSDIEGSEFAIFRRESTWLDRIDRVVMEVHTDFGDPDDLSRIMQEHGFESAFIDNDGRRVETLDRTTSGYLYSWRKENNR